MSGLVVAPSPLAGLRHFFDELGVVTGPLILGEQVFVRVHQSE